MRLPRIASAPARARQAVTACFGGLLGEETLDDVLLVVSELVTNALRHGSGDIELRMAYDADHVTGAVSDDGAGFARRRRLPDRGQVGGHGLHIVGRVATRWGLTEGTTNVWFEIDARR